MYLEWSPKTNVEFCMRKRKNSIQIAINSKVMKELLLVDTDRKLNTWEFGLYVGAQYTIGV